MALGNREKYCGEGPTSALATLASQKNPDGSTFAMNVGSPVTQTSDIGFSVTAVVGGTTLPNQACSKVTLQNRETADDGVTAQTESVWVMIGGVKVFELLNGQSAVVYVTNANLVSVRSFANTSLVSGTISA